MDDPTTLSSPDARPVSLAPPDRAGAWERLDPRYVTLLRQTGSASAAVMSIVWLALIVVLTMSQRLESYRNPSLIVWAVLTAALSGWRLYRPALVYRHSSYRLDGEAIEIRRGALTHRYVTVPRSRVQHTDVSQGPMERHHGLGTLHIFTAGMQYSLVTLAGIEHSRALAIRDSLLPRDHVVRT